MLYDKACGATASCEDGDPAAVHWSYGERGPAGHNVFALTGSFAFIAKETTCLPHMPCNGGTSYCPANTAPMGCKHFPYGCGVMRNGDALQPGDCVYNPYYDPMHTGNPKAMGGTLFMQDDGNLVIYPNGWVPSDGIDLLEVITVRVMVRVTVRVMVGVRLRVRAMVTVRVRGLWLG